MGRQVDGDDRPRRKNGSRKKGSGGGSQTIFIVLSVAAGIFLLLCLGIIVLVFPAMNQVREAVDNAQSAANQKQSANQLRMIGLSIHNYHSAYRQLPPGKIVREDGVAICGWQASILPFIDQAPVYNRLNFNEGWDSPQNKSLYANMLPMYLHPGVREVSDVSGMPLMHYAGNSQVFLENKCLDFQDITDGSSNTIMVGEVTSGLKPWGMPGNVRDPADGIGPAPNQFKGPSPRGTNFAFCDGTVRFVSENINPETLRAMATPAGREPPFDF